MSKKLISICFQIYGSLLQNSFEYSKEVNSGRVDCNKTKNGNANKIKPMPTSRLTIYPVARTGTKASLQYHDREEILYMLSKVEVRIGVEELQFEVAEIRMIR